jgi:hypothetical protein
MPIGGALGTEHATGLIDKIVEYKVGKIVRQSTDIGSV